MAKTNTSYTHIGRDPKRFGHVVNSPVIRGSTKLFYTFADYQKALTGTLGRPTYGRYGNEATCLFCDDFSEFVGAAGVVLTGCGNAAFSTALLGLLNAGDHLLIADTVYDPTRHFCNNELKRFGIEVTFYDPTLGEEIEKLVQPNTKVIYAESPGSLTFEIQDIPAISAVAKKAGAIMMMDNTWGMPGICDPFALGVDVYILSASKYLSGHSDLLMGMICANETYWPAIKRAHKSIGANASVDDIFLLQRGIRTLGVRMPAHEKSGLEMAKWLEARPEVTRVMHPALPSCPGHELWKRDYKGSNGLFAFTTKPMSNDQIAAFVDSLKHFGMGWSWGGFESLILPLWVDSIRTASKAPEGQLFRVHIGLEDIEDLKDDLAAGFERAAKA